MNPIMDCTLPGDSPDGCVARIFIGGPLEGLIEVMPEHIEEKKVDIGGRTDGKRLVLTYHRKNYRMGFPFGQLVLHVMVLNPDLPENKLMAHALTLAAAWMAGDETAIYPADIEE